MKKLLLLAFVFIIPFLISAQVIETPASDITVECDGNGNTDDLNAWLASNGGATENDTCGNITWTNDFTSLDPDFCSGYTTVTFTATGDCGTETTIATFSVIDTTPPILVTGGSSMSVACENFTEQFDSWVDSFAEDSFTDFCSNVSVSLILSNESPECGETVVADFGAVDACGNASAITSFFSIQEAPNFCPTSPITLSSQLEVNMFDANYPNCTDIQNGLIISGADITDLTPLSQINSVAGTFSVENNPLLTSLDGLHNITEFNSVTNNLTINNNNQLEDISALGNMTLVSDDTPYFTTRVSNNPQLISLSGLSIVNSGYYLIIDNNDSLVDLNGLGSILVEEIFITNNDLLQNFDGINGDLPIQIYIENNSTLSDVSAMENMNFNPLYYPLLSILNNQNLSNCNIVPFCTSIASYYSEGGSNPSYQIENNAEGCNSITQVAYSCGLIPTNDNCEDAVVLTPGQPEELYDDFGSASTQIPSCNDVDRIDVWFAFFSGEFTSIDIITSGGYNLQLWEGTTCDTLIHVPDACGENYLLDIPVTPNTNYYIQVWSCQSCRHSITQLTNGLFDIVVQDGALSTEEHSLNEARLYPNPFNNSLNINTNQSITKVEVYNLLGQKVFEISPKNKKTLIDFSNQVSGMYLVKVKSIKSEQIFKVVKQ